MAKKVHFYYDSRDGRTRIHAIRWVPDREIKCVLQIAHGMVEHMERYQEFAEFLTGLGVLVTGNDHLGHGSSVKSEEDFGYFSEYNGNNILLQDIHRLKRMTRDKYPGIPYYILGHSMGSFYVRQYLCRYGRGIDGAIIMGTGNQPKALVRAGVFLTSFLAKFRGWRHRSRLVDGLAFGSYNKKLKNPRTDRDWLTKEESYVDAYINDKRCMFMFSLNAYYHMFAGLLYLADINRLAQMPRKLPVLFVSGAEDPVGNYGAGVREVVKMFEEVGMEQVEYKLYPEDRHEILNETDRLIVYEDLYQWIENLNEKKNSKQVEKPEEANRHS